VAAFFVPRPLFLTTVPKKIGFTRATSPPPYSPTNFLIRSWDSRLQKFSRSESFSSVFFPSQPGSTLHDVNLRFVALPAFELTCPLSLQRSPLACVFLPPSQSCNLNLRWTHLDEPPRATRCLGFHPPNTIGPAGRRPAKSVPATARAS